MDVEKQADVRNNLRAIKDFRFVTNEMGKLVYSVELIDKYTGIVGQFSPQPMIVLSSPESSVIMHFYGNRDVLMIHLFTNRFEVFVGSEPDIYRFDEASIKTVIKKINEIIKTQLN